MRISRNQALPAARTRSIHGRYRLLASPLVWLAVLLLAGCATPRPTIKHQRTPQEVRAQLTELMPASLADRQDWAVDIETAFRQLKLIPSTENLCATLAVIEQETGYKADPEVPGLARIAREEIDRRAASFKIPKSVVAAALSINSTDGRSYADRIAAVRTERHMSELFEEFIGRVPLGKRLFASANPVRTGGSMQVSIEFSQQFADRHGYPYGSQLKVRDEVFLRRGGVYFGIAHLLAYRNSYDRHLYRYADFNAGWYASRNAAFQAAVSKLSGVRLALDGDLMLPAPRFGAAPVGATEAAVRSLAPRLGMSESAIRSALEKSDRFEFETTGLYDRVYALAQQEAGTTLPRAVLPQIDLQSPKFTRKLTTAWFANRVQERYQRCVNRAFAQ